MLSHASARTYRYNAGVDDLGGRLLRARNGRGLKNADLAKRALGPESTPEERRDFANYLARIERNEVPSPGLQLFEQIATAYGLTLSKFFALIEHQTNTDLPPSADSVTTESIRSGTKSKGGAGADTSLPASDDIDIKSIVSALGVTAIEVLERAVDRGFDRLAAHQARPAPRRQPHRRPLRRKAS